MPVAKALPTAVVLGGVEVLAAAKLVIVIKASLVAAESSIDINDSIAMKLFATYGLSFLQLRFIEFCS